MNERIKHQLEQIENIAQGMSPEVHTRIEGIRKAMERQNPNLIKRLIKKMSQFLDETDETFKAPKNINPTIPETPSKKVEKKTINVKYTPIFPEELERVFLDKNRTYKPFTSDQDLKDLTNLVNTHLEKIKTSNQMEIQVVVVEIEIQTKKQRYSFFSEILINTEMEKFTRNGMKSIAEIYQSNICKINKQIK